MHAESESVYVFAKLERGAEILRNHSSTHLLRNACMNVSAVDNTGELGGKSTLTHWPLTSGSKNFMASESSPAQNTPGQLRDLPRMAQGANVATAYTCVVCAAAAELSGENIRDNPVVHAEAESVSVLQNSSVVQKYCIIIPLRTCSAMHVRT